MRFLLDFERASAWGLDPDRDLVLRVEFSHEYIRSPDPPKVTNVLQAPPDVALNQVMMIDPTEADTTTAATIA